MTFTLTLTGLAALGGIIFGTLLAMMRLSSHKWLQLPATGYVNLMRSIPLLLVIFWFYFLVPYHRRLDRRLADARSRWARSPRRSSRSRCSRRRTTPRSCARASSRFRAARCGRAMRSGSTTGSRCARSCCRRRSATCCRSC